jgi:hypothetical protein
MNSFAAAQGNGGLHRVWTVNTNLTGRTTDITEPPYDAPTQPNSLVISSIKVNLRLTASPFAKIIQKGSQFAKSCGVTTRKTEDRERFPGKNRDAHHLEEETPRVLG